uniref:CSON013427 protein n=1 Tax=Culicoides sonorensis TaxID=179676 RepID=A0A336M7Z6_CULSO
MIKFMIFLLLAINVSGSLANYQDRGFPYLRKHAVKREHYAEPVVHWTPLEDHHQAPKHLKEPVHVVHEEVKHHPAPVVHWTPVEHHHEAVKVKNHHVPVVHELVVEWTPVQVHHEEKVHKKECDKHRHEKVQHVPTHAKLNGHVQVQHEKVPMHHKKSHNLHKRSATNYYNNYNPYDSYPSYYTDTPSYSNWEPSTYDNDYQSNYPTYDSYDGYYYPQYTSYYPSYGHKHNKHCLWSKSPVTTTTTQKPTTTTEVTSTTTTGKPEKQPQTTVAPAPSTKPNKKLTKKQQLAQVVQAVADSVLDVKELLLNPNNPQRPGNQVRPITVYDPERPELGEQEGLFVPVNRPDVRSLVNDTLKDDLDQEDVNEDELTVIEDPVNLDASILLDKLRIETGSVLNGETKFVANEDTVEENEKKDAEETKPENNVNKDPKSLTLEDFDINVRSLTDAEQ